MALVPCKTCGVLNSSEADICLSCGYPTAGRPRPAIFKWAALVLFLLFTFPLLMNLVGWLKFQLQPKPSPSPKVFTSSNVSGLQSMHRQLIYHH